METVTGGSALFKVTADIENVDASFFVTNEFEKLDGLTQCDLLHDIMGMAITAYNKAYCDWHSKCEKGMAGR